MITKVYKKRNLLYTLGVVHHLTCGHQDKVRVVAVPVPTATWFLQMKKRWWALPAVSTPVPKPEIMKIMMDKSPKAG